MAIPNDFSSLKRAEEPDRPDRRREKRAKRQRRVGGEPFPRESERRGAGKRRQRGGEDHLRQRGEANPGAAGGEQLGVAAAESVAPAAAREEPADERHQIARRQRCAARLAARAGPDDSAVRGQAADDDADKAADDRRRDKQAPAGDALLHQAGLRRTSVPARSSCSVRKIEASRPAQPRPIASISSCSQRAARRIGVDVARARSSASPRSLRASASEKRGAKSPLRKVSGRRTLRLIMLPSAASLKTLTIVAASIPALTPTVQHSAITRSSVKLAELCMILAIDPVPIGPVWMMRLAIASSNGRARAKV